MKILTIIKDDRITGIEYGKAEISTKSTKNAQEQFFKTRYTNAQFNQLKKIINRTRHK